MNTTMIVNSVLLTILLVMSAIFSGSETSFFSLNHLERDALGRRGRGALRRFLRGCLRSPGDLLVTILTGNMIVNLFFASIVDRMVARFTTAADLPHAWLYSIVAGTVLLLVFGEMTPKNIAVRHPVAFFTGVSRFLYPVHVLITPLRKVLRAVERSIVALMSGPLERGRDPSALVRAALHSGVKRGIIHPTELTMLDTFMDLREKTAGDVFIPRTDIRGVKAASSLADLLAGEESLAEGLPIPVHTGDLDHIVGYVTVEDVLEAGREDLELRTVASVMRPSMPVPESQSVLQLFEELMAQDTELAVVVDEYGGTAGIITYQYVIQELLKAYGPGHGNPIERTAEGGYLVTGDTEIAELERAMEVEIGEHGRTGHSRTIGGFITDLAGEIPGAGARFETENVELVVRRASQTRVIEAEARHRS